MGCDTVLLGQWFPAFRKVEVPLPARRVLLEPLDPEDGTAILRNVGNNSPNNMASHATNLNPRIILVWTQ
jgi:hypothetical protein